jgi:hypothetical protein
MLLYGPPAVGKLTIAKEIARLTGFKVFHNHLTVNVVAAIFPRGTPAYRRLLWDIRYVVFAEAARANIEGLLFTVLYRRDQEPWIARCVEIVERFRGNVCLVHLHCHAETVRQRVVGEDRQQHGKITSVERLNELLSYWEPQSPFEAATRWDSLSLNTDVLGPVEAAHWVVAHYRLPTARQNLTTHWSGFAQKAGFEANLLTFNALSLSTLLPSLNFWAKPTGADGPQRTLFG